VSSLADVFRVLTEMRDAEVVTNYAIGGATAVLFYAEPTRTYDVDVFAILPSVEESTLVSLAPVYQWAQAQGFVVDGEHVLVHGVPVQILPAYNPLVIDAVETAREHDYQGTPVRVVDPEHLVALALQAGGARRRERAWLILQAGVVDRARLRGLLDAHAIHVEIPEDD
jgi:Nucleotidyl transferase of unknown function (DUF2204)